MPPSHHTDPNCIFCKIIARQIPCHKLYEDDHILAFLDIGPLVQGHALVIPKTHVATLMQATPETLAAISVKLPALSRALLAATNAPACHLLVNNGPEAQQSVPHLHFHLIPRRQNDPFHIPWNPIPLDKPAAANLAASIHKLLQNP